MSGFGQTFQTAWLERAKPSIAWQKIDVGTKVTVGETVWSSWWFSPWIYVSPVVLYFGQTLKSTWLTAPQTIMHVALLRPHIDAGTENWGRGYIIWINWWFSGQFIPPQRLAITASLGPYNYAGQSTNLGALHNYSLSLGGTIYDFEGAPAQSDFAMDGNTIPYALVAPNTVLIGHAIHLPVSFGHYSYFGGSGTSFRYLRGNLKGPILTTSTRTVLGPKRVSEEIGAPFDFSNSVLAGDVLSLPQVTITVWSGVDANPQALWQGSALVSGNTVYVTLVDGVAGVIYQVEVTVTASVSGILSRMAFLTVLPDSL